MKSKLIKISLGLIGLIFLGVMIQSCCRDKTEYKICEISMQIDSYYGGDDSLSYFNINTEDQIDTSYNQFNYSLQGLVTPVGDVCRIPLPFINTVYAFQPCPLKIVDSIPRKNINLSFDRDISYNGNVIAAGTNLMSDANLSNALEYDYYSEQSYSGRIFMDSTNFTLLQLDTGYYKMNMTTTTIFGNKQQFEKKVLFKKD